MGKKVTEGHGPQTLRKIAGARMTIWKQDPWVPHVGHRTTYVHTPVCPGPSDAELRVEFPDGGDPVEARDGHFLFDPTKDDLATEPGLHRFNAIHTFAVSRQVLTTYQRALERVDYLKPFQWIWGSEPLVLVPHWKLDKERGTGFYDRGEHKINFPYFKAKKCFPPPGAAGGSNKKIMIYTCQSFDLIAHEMGHAILDALLPDYSDASGDGPTLKEAFCDLAILFTLLGQMDIVEAIVAESEGDLLNPSFLPSIAERYSLVKSGGSDEKIPVLAYTFSGDNSAYPKMRTLLNDFTVDSGSLRGAHEESQVFSGAVYRILALTFRDHRRVNHYDPAESLYRIGRHLLEVVIRAYLSGPRYQPTLSQIARQMIYYEDNSRWRNIMHGVFFERGLLRPAPQ